MDDLWEAASGAHERMTHEAARAQADAELEGIMPFLIAARSDQEFFHRLATAGTALTAVEARCGLEQGELTEVVTRRYALYREALAEGQDSTVALDPLLQGGQYGSGPEQPLEHEEAADFSHGYSEVPMGNLTGPDPAVTQPRQNTPGPVTQAAGMRRRADASPGSSMTSPYTPPNLGLGSGSMDVGTPGPDSGGFAPSVPAGVGGMAGGSVSPVGQTTSQPGVSSSAPPTATTASRDPVRRRVQHAAAVIQQANPSLPAAEADRLARKAVARYMRTADLTDSVMDNGPTETGGGDSGGSSSGGGGGAASHMLEGQGLRSMLPGAGNGPGAGAGGGAGAAGELGELAEVAAL